METQKIQILKNKIAEFEDKYGVKLDSDTLKRTAVDLTGRDPIIWGMKYRNLKGTPYRFELPLPDRKNPKLWNRHRPFLKQIIADQSTEKACQKSRQSGVSESSVTEVIWFLSEHPNTKAVYTFPSDRQMGDFSQTRIDPVFEEADYLRALKGKVFNVGLKEIRGVNSYLYLRSTTTGRLGEGIDADAVYFDEKDRMPDKVEDAFRQSLSASAFGYLREFSTPTLPGQGVNRSFSASKQYRWFVKCDSGHRQTLVYPDNIGYNIDIDPTADYVADGSCYYKCSHPGCVSDINRWDGEWVCVANEHIKDKVGYHINQLSCVWLSADWIIREKLRMRFADLFYNYVLGEVYASNEGLITEAALHACLDATKPTIPHIRKREYTQVVAGIDWGAVSVVTVAGILPNGKIELCGLKYIPDDADVLIAAKDAAQYLSVFSPNLVVADLGYGRDRNMYLQKVFPDRVFSCIYTNTENDRSFNPTWTEDKVTVNRTAHIRNMLELIKIRKVIFPGRIDEYQVMFKHLLSLVLLHEEVDEPGKEDTKIVEKIGHTGRDDTAHSWAYTMLAASKLMSTGGFMYTFV